MSFKKEFINIIKEIKPYFIFLVKDIILIGLTVLTLKVIVQLLEFAFKERANTLVNLLESVSQIGIFIMFLLHTGTALIELVKKSFERISRR